MKRRGAILVENSIPSVPASVLEQNVIVHLPPVDILTCRLACKSWNRFISGPEFFHLRKCLYPMRYFCTSNLRQPVMNFWNFYGDHVPPTRIKGSWKYSGLLLFNEHLQWNCLHGDGAYWSDYEETLATSLEVLHMQSNYWGLPSTPATHLSSLVSLRPSKSYFTILSGHSLRPTFPAPVVLCCPSTYWQRGACFSNLFFNNRQVNSINGKGLIPRNRRGNWHHPSSQTLVCFYQWSIVYKELFRLGNMAGSCPRRRRFDPLRWRRSAFLLAWNRMIAYNMVSKQWFRVFEKINMSENVEFF